MKCRLSNNNFYSAWLLSWAKWKNMIKHLGLTTQGMSVRPGYQKTEVYVIYNYALGVYISSFGIVDKSKTVWSHNLALKMSLAELSTSGQTTRGTSPRPDCLITVKWQSKTTSPGDMQMSLRESKMDIWRGNCMPKLQEYTDFLFYYYHMTIYITHEISYMYGLEIALYVTYMSVICRLI